MVLHEKMTQGIRLKSGQIYRIPVVVHVVHNEENTGEVANIGYKQVVGFIV